MTDHAHARDLLHRSYTYRADGRLTGVDDRSGTSRFGIDTAGRVTAVDAADWTERYVYDEAGNQTDTSWPAEHSGPEATGPRDYVGTSLMRAGTVRFEHDAAGRVALRQKTRLSRKPDTWRYAWDAEDRLTSVVAPDGTRWRYLYDALGRRTAKQRLAADSETAVEQTTFTWDGATVCEQRTTTPEAPRPVVLTWDHEGLRPIAQSERVALLDAPQDEIRCDHHRGSSRRAGHRVPWWRKTDVRIEPRHGFAGAVVSRPAVQKALAATERALSGIDEELARHAAGQGSVSSAGQLTQIRSQLTQMADQLSSPELPPKEQHVHGMGRVIADSWPYDSPLGTVILEAERLYLKA